MLQIKVTDVLQRAQFYLNDVDKNFFSDTTLMAPFKAAYDDLKENLYDNNIDITNVTSASLVIPVGTVGIGDGIGPSLPNNLVEIFDLWERLSGTSDDFCIMERKQFLPLTEILTTNLAYWSFQAQIVRLLGATTVRDVKMNYIGDTLSLADQPEGTINLFNAKSFLSYRTAALAAKFLGENPERADDLNGNAQRAIDMLLNTNIKNSQGITTRRRPFMAGWKSSGFLSQ